MSSDDVATQEPASTTPVSPSRSRPLDAFGRVGAGQHLQNLAGVVWRLLILLIGIAVLVKALGLVAGVAMAMFIAMIVTALAMPTQRLLRKFMWDPLATVLALLFLVIIVAAVFGFVARSIVNQWDDLVTSAQSGLTQMEDWLKTGPLHLDDTAVSGLLTDATKWIGQTGELFAKDIPSVLGNFGDFITAASVMAFGSFFFVNSGGVIWKWVLSWIPEHVRTEVDDSGAVAWVCMSGYVRGIVLVAFADGVLVFIGLIILDVPLAAALAVVVMFGAMIPVIGAPIATLFAAVVALATEGLTTALLVLVLTVVVGSFDGDIMQPLIMGHAVQLHPLAIVSVIAAGTLSFGIIGALLAVPVSATIYSLAKYLTGRMPPPREKPPKIRLPRLPRFLRKKQPSTAGEPTSATA